MSTCDVCYIMIWINENLLGFDFNVSETALLSCFFAMLLQPKFLYVSNVYLNLFNLSFLYLFYSLTSIFFVELQVNVSHRNMQLISH